MEFAKHDLLLPSGKVIAQDSYPKADRKTLVKYLDSCAWALEQLNEAYKKFTIVSEKSKIDKAIVMKRKKVSKILASQGVATADSAKNLQQWFTIDELAEECMDKFKEHCSEVWEDQETFYLEPSAGAGDILQKLPLKRRKGVDLEPKHDEVEKMNFYHTSRKFLGIDDKTPLVLIGNPPFGNVASEFFNHATKNLKPDYIAWILPNSFLSRSKRNKIDPHYHLIYVMNITCCYVFQKDGKLYNMPSMFGIWKRETVPLIQPTIEGNSDFEIVSNKEERYNIYKEGLDSKKTYFWIRKNIQHKNTTAQSPIFETAQSLMNSYVDVKMNATPEEKLLGSFCIKCSSPESYDKVYNFFSTYDWPTNIGQFITLNSNRDWQTPTRLGLTKTIIYGSYNDSLDPYKDTTKDGFQNFIKNQRSAITRAMVAANYGASVVKGGRRKKRTKKKARRKRRKRSRRKYK